MSNWDHSYTTTDEILFLTGMLTGHVDGRGAHITHGWAGAGSNLTGFRNYADTVLADLRGYPKTVDVARVKAWIRAALEDLPRAAAAANAMPVMVEDVADGEAE